MKTATIWTAISLTAVICFSLGLALGSRIDSGSLLDVKFLNDWQGLINAVTVILTTGATLQAGWWALSGPREQLAFAQNESRVLEKKRYQALRARILFDLNLIVEYCIKSIYYIQNGKMDETSPQIDKNTINDLTAIIEVKDNRISEHAAALVGEIQVAHSWVSNIHFEKARLANAVPIAILQCIILHESCMKWFNFARNESEYIDEIVTREDIMRFIHFMRIRKNNIFKQEDFDMARLNREIDMRFPPSDSERNPSESDGSD